MQDFGPFTLMKIALLDLNHTTCGIHTVTVPLSIGLIATYVRKYVDPTLDIRLFKEANKVLETLKSWVPDILGLAQYAWNSKLNLYIAKLIKEKNPECITIAGGPNLELSTKGKYNFLKTHPYIDICVSYDGEIPFAEIVKRVLSRESINSIKKNPPMGAYSTDREKGTLVELPGKPPRLESLDVFGAVYAEGTFDPFLKEGYHPFVQTHRGCPFTCAFCHTSDAYYSKMLFLSPEIFRKDMEYLGKLFAGRHDITLYIANTNMSLFPQDFAIAEIIREIQEKYDWPRLFNVNSGKDPKKLLKMLSIINIKPSLALQTLTPEVLENIRRRNISFEEYCAFQQEVMRRTDETSTTELILSLPAETKETFLKTLRAVMNSGVQNIVIYTLMNLKGTPLASEEFAKRFGHISNYRIVPRQFSIINRQKIFDAEEVIVGTKYMSFEDYIELRGVSFTVAAFFGSTELIPLKRFLIEYKVDIAEWIFNIHSHVSEFSDLKRDYENFLKETREELFPTREALIEFYNKQENYNDLVAGRRGDNLNRKYKFIILSENYDSYLKLAVSEARKLAQKKMEEEKANELINDLEKYLFSRNLKDFLTKDGAPPTKQIELTYDIPRWLKTVDGTKLLEEFNESASYIVKFLPDSKEKLDKFMRMNKDPILSLQILYRDGSIKDFWPIWEKNKN